MVITFFPEEKEILRDEDAPEKRMILSREIRKEIMTLYKLGLEDYEIKYLISLKKKREVGFKWED